MKGGSSITNQNIFYSWFLPSSCDKTLFKTNLRRKGFLLLGLQFIFHHEGCQGSIWSRSWSRDWRNAAYWLAFHAWSLFSYTAQHHLPSGGITHIGLLPATPVISQEHASALPSGHSAGDSFLAAVPSSTMIIVCFKLTIKPTSATGTFFYFCFLMFAWHGHHHGLSINKCHTLFSSSSNCPLLTLFQPLDDSFSFRPLFWCPTACIALSNLH